jgi:hypothetical protein
MARPRLKATLESRDKVVANYLARIRAGTSRSHDLSSTPQWLEKNTASPVDSSKPWSFKDHEYQITILADTATDLCSRKCSQVGFSEMMARQALAMLSIIQNYTLIYTLPTSSFASKFSKGRIDPVIEASSYLKSMMKQDVNSSELKQIAQSFLYVFGTQGKASGISVPAHGLFCDEVDFCDQTTLTKYNSRLGHAGTRRIKRMFSTPTVSGYGIDAEFMLSSQAYYLVKCDKCHTYQSPDFLNDVELPGFDRSLHFLEKEDVIALRDWTTPDVREPSFTNEGSRTSESRHPPFVRCPSCRQPINWKQFCDPTQRQWVHKYPDNPYHGYQVLPWDVPKYNPLQTTINGILEYKSKKDWINFKIGLPYEDAETSFLEPVIRKNALPATHGFHKINPPNYPSASASSPSEYLNPKHPALISAPRHTVMGIDVGKTSWVVIALPVSVRVSSPQIHVQTLETKSSTALLVVHKERIRQDGDNTLLHRLLYLQRIYNSVCGVIDAGPDFSTSKAFIANGLHHQNWASQYTRNARRGTLENYTLNEDEQVVSVARTEAFNELVKEVNSSQILFTEQHELPTFIAHLTALKRVDYTNDRGEEVTNWVSTGDDHFGHALLYCNTAYKIMEELKIRSRSEADRDPIPVLPSFTKIKMKVDSGSNKNDSFSRFFPQ